MKRFWDKVKIVDPNECWLWTAYRDKNGYGGFRLDGKTVVAHRVSLSLSQGITLPPPEILCLHSCDNPPCCNYNHLRWGSRVDNAKDAKERERFFRASGQNNAMAKLSPADVEEIKLAYNNGTVFQRELAEKYQVTQAAISLILSGSRWGDNDKNS